MFKTMEPPYKKQRLSGSKFTDLDLRQRRARNDSHLKSIFESIFDKYSKDFDGIGDEIDLRTGEIVVNNGHILGIRNETDTGQTRNLSEETRSDSISKREEEEGSRQDYGEGTISSNESVIAEGETAMQALCAIDSIVASVEIEDPSKSFGKTLHEQIADYNSEEDELADKAIEWLTPREAQAISHEKWQLPVQGPTFTGASPIEEAWRAPSLPDCNPFHRTINRKETRMASKSSPVRKPCPTMWTTPQRSHQESKRPVSAALDVTMPQHVESQIRTVDNASLTRHKGRGLTWTHEEEDQLRHLKLTTNLSYRNMEHLFPNRHKESIGCKWRQMVNRDESLKVSAKANRERLSPSPPVSNTAFAALDSNNIVNKQSQDEENRAPSAKALPSGQNRSGHSPSVSAHTENDLLSKSRDPKNSIDGLLNVRVQPVEESCLLGDRKLRSQCSRTLISPTAESNKCLSKGLRDDHIPLYHSDSVEDEHNQSSQFSSPFLEDTATCKRKLTETLNPDHFEIVPPGATCESEAPSTTSEPDNSMTANVVPTANTSELCSPESAMSITVGSTDAVVVSPTILQQHGPLPQSGVPDAHKERSPLLPKTRQSIMIPRRDCATILTPLEEKYKVQVVVPRPKPHGTSEHVGRPGMELGERRDTRPLRTVGGNEYVTDSTMSAEPRKSKRNHDKALPHRDAPSHVEIPDSQPDTSSPTMAEETKATFAAAELHPRRKTSALAPLGSTDSGSHAAKDIMADSEFIDELSIEFQPPKRQTQESRRSKVVGTQSPNNLTQLDRPRKRPKPSSFNNAIVDSFPSATTELCDCSEDELSFM